MPADERAADEVMRPSVRPVEAEADVTGPDLRGGVLRNRRRTRRDLGDEYVPATLALFLEGAGGRRQVGAGRLALASHIRVAICVDGDCVTEIVCRRAPEQRRVRDPVRPVLMEPLLDEEG